MEENEFNVADLENRVSILEDVIRTLLNGMSRGYQLDKVTSIPAPSLNSLKKAREKMNLPKDDL